MKTPESGSKQQIYSILKQSSVVAIIGCSNSKYRTSYYIAEYLQQNGFKIVPINPNETKILGEKVYNSILDLPDDLSIDIIDIFRNKEYTDEMMDEIVEWKEKTGQNPLIWTQLDVSTDSAKEKAEKNDLLYVENRCIMVEHKQM